MAQIDDLQAHVASLDTAVRGFLATVGASAEALRAEIDALHADAAVENEKVAGVDRIVTDLESAVAAFSPPVPPVA